MKSAKILKQKMDDNTLALGVLATFHFWPGMVELAMRAGLDYLIIDLEHLTFGAEAVAEACAIGRRADFPVLIRPPAAEFTPLRLAMDLGPCGLLVPYVESVATLDIVREAIYMKPRGRRRPGGMGNFWVPDYQYSTWKKEVEDDFIILPQIESRVGLANLNAIAADPVTTALAVGPYDLSADLGVCWQPEHPKLQEAVRQIQQAGEAVEKTVWMIGDGADLMKKGFRFLCITEPTMLLENTLRDMTQRLKADLTPPISGRDQTAAKNGKRDGHYAQAAAELIHETH
jgi:2-keto-3-deoxy-L-rhamnonate aldolase RhmA